MPSNGFDRHATEAWLYTAQRALRGALGQLTELDAARGDADHGTNMDRGFTAIAEHLRTHHYPTPGATLVAASGVLASAIGGTSGPLWAAALRATGKKLGDADPVPAPLLAEALSAAADVVARLGGAKEGDNTMLDALLPASRALTDKLAAGATLQAALAIAADQAKAGADATAGRAAVKGRASYVGDRGIGNADPGAVSAALIIQALHDSVADSH